MSACPGGHSGPRKTGQSTGPFPPFELLRRSATRRASLLARRASRVSAHLVSCGSEGPLGREGPKKCGKVARPGGRHQKHVSREPEARGADLPRFPITGRLCSTNYDLSTLANPGGHLFHELRPQRPGQPLECVCSTNYDQGGTPCPKRRAGRHYWHGERPECPRTWFPVVPRTPWAGSVPRSAERPFIPGTQGLEICGQGSQIYRDSRLAAAFVPPTTTAAPRPAPGEGFVP